MTRSDEDDVCLRGVCRAWFGDVPVHLRPVVGEGFSGAALVRAIAVSGGRDLVLKPFPEAARPHVAWVHRLVWHLRASGCDMVPGALERTAGGTIEDDGHGGIWEAVPFVAGSATDTPSMEQAAAALQALARIHLAAAEWPLEPITIGPAGAVLRRVEQAARLLDHPWRLRRRADASRTALAIEMSSRLEKAIATAGASDLAAALRCIIDFRSPHVVRHAVLRDVWSGHVLFAGDRPTRVAGIVDLHAASVDTPATDVARLIGSWCRDADVPPDVAWREAVAAYERVRPLASAERLLISWLEASGTILGLDNWFRWVLLEGRQFADAAQVVRRVDRMLSRLAAAIGTVIRIGTAV
ncbi:MAG: phosphotransferase [Planctomycetaceae bacterium]